MTTSTSGPPRLYTISVIAETGPISRGPTSATAHSGRITEITPIPKPPTTIGTTRSGKYGMVRVSVEPYSMAPSTSRPPPMISQRGAMCGASRAASTLPSAERRRERDEADAGPQRRVTDHVLH